MKHSSKCFTYINNVMFIGVDFPTIAKREESQSKKQSKMADGRTTLGMGRFLINLMTCEGDKRPLSVERDKLLESGNAPPLPGQQQPGCNWVEFLLLISGQ